MSLSKPAAEQRDEILLRSLLKEIDSKKDPVKAKLLQGFFKTGKGEYGEGDIFLGLVVPVQRKIAKEYKHLPLHLISHLIDSRIHEHRLISLMILIERFKAAEEKEKDSIVAFYKSHMRFINNWDLVDLSAHRILGEYYFTKDRSCLLALAKSKDLWERRISILSTFNFIGKGDFTTSLQIATILVDDHHDLIHKAVGWMLREIGKRDILTERAFLDKHHKTMPRTMLRYAIERFDEPTRQHYLKK